MNKNTIAALIIGLSISVINCIALEITTFSPYKDTAFKFAHSYKLEFSSNNKIGEFEDSGEFTIKRNLNNRTLNETINTLKVFIIFKNEILDQQEFNAIDENTNEKRYAKDFKFNDKKGHVEYTLNIKFGEDKEFGKIVKSIEAKISKISINGIELTKEEKGEF